MIDFQKSEKPDVRKSEVSKVQKENTAIYVTIVGFKGGVSKTTSAVHLAACLQLRAPTLLVDGDSNRSALAWAEAGRLPFKVVDENDAASAVGDYAHVVIDTAARPSLDDLRALAENCDMVILPTTAEAMALRAMFETAGALSSAGAKNFKALVTIVPPRPSRDGDEAQASIVSAGLPVFTATIRRAVAFSKASLEGCLVSEVNDPRAAACWADYVRVAEELT